MNKIPFTVDSALLRELGERLVGKPHIALAELVKNSYDADATRVVVSFGPDRIEVIDNGHGMSFDEFKRFWMRVGSPHKEEQRVSKRLGRPMTGSKGVGRLAVQFLADKLVLRTVSDASRKSELVVNVNWDEAVKAGDLTKAEALYEKRDRLGEFPGGSAHGTGIALAGLKQEWSSEDIVNLAREIWWLQPPFRTTPDLTSDKQKMFKVRLRTPDEEAVEQFKRQMGACLDIWYARLVGKLAGRNREGEPEVLLSLEFADGAKIDTKYPIPRCRLYSVDFEIRVFHLVYRQPHGVKVEEAREYFNKYGGVHVYDSGFHLPYYGVETDWLGIEKDHSHRLSQSKLLPDHLQVPEGMTYLPTNSRLFGVVHVNTAKERTLSSKRGEGAGREQLAIQVTRDRLADNRAFQDLRKIVRWALDFYATQEAKRALERSEAERPTEPLREKFRRVEDVLRNYRDQIPKPAYAALRDEMKEAIQASETEAEVLVRQVGLLGSLATAGTSALAYEHEVGRQLRVLDDVVKELRASRAGDVHRLKAVADRLAEWIERARATRGLFTYLMVEENREKRARFRARALVDDVVAHMSVLLRGVEVNTASVDESLRLPDGTFAEWSAIFQNVLTNACNAMLDSRRKLISLRSHARGRTRAMLMQDTGVGVDLATADELFKPFVRKLKISPERQALGLGGSGLGLSIVRMIAENLGCTVGFAEPDKGFKTAFQLSWSERA